MPILYKTICETKILHEYFLTREDGSSIFDKALPQERLDYLLEEASNDRDTINNDLEFAFPEVFKNDYASMDLKVIPSYSGFKLAGKVTALPQPDGSIQYTPYSQIPAGINIYILANRKEVRVDSYTNARMKRTFPATWFFSADDLADVKTGPFLTNAISNYDATFNYEQGELYKQGADIIPFYASADVNDKIKGAGFASENDRMLVPLQFNYTFPSVTGMTEAKFSLKDKDANEVFTQTVTGSAGMPQQVLLSLLDKALPLPIISDLPLINFVYTLDVTGDNGYTQSKKIVFGDEFSDAGAWAVIHFRLYPFNAAFGLADSTGILKTSKNPLGKIINTPVFEIPFKSRFAYWRFFNNKGLKLDVKPSLANYVIQDGDGLITKRPIPLTRDFFLLREKGSALTAYVPNPLTGSLKDAGSNRMALDIMVPKSELFPVVP